MKFKNPALNVPGFGRNTQLVGKILRNFENFDNNSIEKWNFKQFSESDNKIGDTLKHFNETSKVR